jgi:hypothetical protein
MNIFTFDIIKLFVIILKHTMNDDLDISWIDKQNKLHTIDKTYYREPMEFISIHSIYVNTDKNIEKISSDKIDVYNNFISKEKILKIIQHSKSIHRDKYKLFDIVLYNIDLEPQHIQDFVQNDVDKNRFFKKFSIVDDIKINPSIFIFHSLNAIYFIFQEIELVLNPIIKPILKIGSEVNVKKHTKKVRIHEPISKPKNKTKYHR